MVLMKTSDHREKFSINFSKAHTKYCLSLHFNADNSYMFVNGKGIFKFKAGNKNVNFPSRFFYKLYLMDLVLLSLGKCL